MNNTRMNFNPSTLPIITLMNQIKNVNRYGLDLQPSYQRGYIWNNDFKEKLIYSLTKHYPIGNIIIRNLEEPNQKSAKSEVVDGQQRLTTISKFINGEIVIKGSIATLIVKENLDYFQEEVEDKAIKKILDKFNADKGIVLKYESLPSRLKSDIETFPLSLTVISNASTKQVSEYFRFVQNQERLKAGEIIESFPDTYLEKYLIESECRNNLLELLSFNDERKEFEKVYYSIIGIFDAKLKLGCTDKQIRDYVSKKTSLEGDALRYVNHLMANLKTISTLNKDLIPENMKSNKRGLKFLMLISGFNLIDFSIDGEEKLKKLYEIDKKLSAFNSAKKDIIKETFPNESEEVVEKYRLLSLIVKGAHPFDRVRDRIRVLKELIETSE